MPTGFFSQGELVPKRPISKGCSSCGLSKKCLNPKMSFSGQGEKKVLIVGESPGKLDDYRNSYFQGESGAYLRNVLDCIGVDLEKDCWCYNAVQCYSEKTPTVRHISACRTRVWKTVEELGPKVIILLGRIPLYSFIGHRWKKDVGTVEKWRGFFIPDRDLHTWLCPVFHPSYLLKQKELDVSHLFYKQDLQRAFEQVDVPLPTFPLEKDCVEITLSEKKAIRWMDHLLGKSPEYVAFDYETTGLKPHKKGHRIVCVSFADSVDHAFAFPITEGVIPHVQTFLKRKIIGKIASNLKFEECWSRVHMVTSVRNWVWDTMQCAHVLDNRPGITSIKFQALVRYGLFDYDSHIEGFLRSENEKDGNAFNRIDKVDMRELLMYCGIDSLLEYRVAHDQMQEIGYAMQ